MNSGDLNKAWINHPFPRRNRIQQSFAIPEKISLFFFIANGLLIWILAKNEILFPWIMGICTFLQFFLLYFTSFNENDPPAWLHFIHPVYGVIIFSTLIQAGVYFLTLITRSFSHSAVIIAQRTVIIQGYICIWALAASSSLLGIYFSYKIIPNWFLFLNSNSALLNLPFSLYMGVIFYILLAIGGWLTLINNVFFSLTKREYYGKNTVKYRKLSGFVLIGLIILSLIYIIFETNLYKWIIGTLL